LIPAAADDVVVAADAAEVGKASVTEMMMVTCALYEHVPQRSDTVVRDYVLVRARAHGRERRMTFSCEKLTLLRLFCKIGYSDHQKTQVL